MEDEVGRNARDIKSGKTKVVGNVDFNYWYEKYIEKSVGKDYNYDIEKQSLKIDVEKDDKIKKRIEFSEKPKIVHKEEITTNNFSKGSGKNYPVKFIGSDHVKFADKKVRSVTVIAGHGVKAKIREDQKLELIYHQPKKVWQKISGITKIRYKGKVLKAEIHWYEANGKREEIKVKRVFNDES